MNNNVISIYLLFKSTKNIAKVIINNIIKNIKYYFENIVLHSTLYILLNDDVFINMLD